MNRKTVRYRRLGREGKENSVATGKIFDNLDDIDGGKRRERTPIHRSPNAGAKVLRSASCADDWQMSSAFNAIDF